MTYVFAFVFSLFSHVLSLFVMFFFPFPFGSVSEAGAAQRESCLHRVQGQGLATTGGRSGHEIS